MLQHSNGPSSGQARPKLGGPMEYTNQYSTESPNNNLDVAQFTIPQDNNNYEELV